MGLGSGLAIEPGFEIGQRGPDAAAAAHRDLGGGLPGHGPSRDEEVGQFLRLRRQELHGLEPGLEPLGEQVELEVAGAEQRPARRKAIEVGEQEVLRFLGTAV